MEKVVIPESGTYKCVILSDGNDKVFRAGYGSFHRDVAREAKSQDSNLSDYYVEGGGRISINETEIRVYGYSVDFGEMNKDAVSELLVEYAKENNKKLINDSGNGY